MRFILAALFSLSFLVCSAYAQPVPGPSTGTGIPGGGNSVSNSSGDTPAATSTATLGTTSGGRTTAICGFSFVAGGATAGSTIVGTIVGVVGGTMTFAYSVATGAGLPGFPLTVPFWPCLPATAVNTQIVVSFPSAGAGSTHQAVTAWGYQY